MRGEFVDVGGARLYYYAAGTRGAGDPVLLVHGSLTSSRLWSAVVPCLPAGHRVVVVDLLGHGRSDPPGDHDLSAGAHGDRLVALAGILGIERACVVGHGLGGQVAQLMARKAPTLVSRLGLVDTAVPGPPTFALLRGVGRLPAALLLPAIRSRLARGFIDPERAARSLDQYLRPFCTPAGHAALHAHLDALADERTPPGPASGPITVPAAIIGGTHDPFVPADQLRALEASFPKATVELLTDSRHYAPEESPEHVARVLTGLLAR